MQTCMEAPNESAARAARFSVLGIIPGQQPKGFTVGVFCGTKMCITPEHVVLREWKIPVVPKWVGLAEQIAALPMDGVMVLRDYPHGNSARYALINGVAATKAGRWVKFIIRQIPSGGIRIIRTGDIGSYFEGRESTQTDRTYKSAYAAVNPNGLAPGALFLGMLWGTNSRPLKMLSCEIRSCPRSVVEPGLCRFHKRFYATDSRGYKGQIDLQDIYPSEEGCDPKLYTGMLYQDAFEWKRVRMFINSGFRMKEEKISNEWWEANITEDTA